MLDFHHEAFYERMHDAEIASAKSCLAMTREDCHCEPALSAKQSML